VHRAIKACLNNETYTPGNWENVGTHCSMTERRADDATRDVVAWLKCFYMQDKINEEFDGVISAVVSFGVFVALNEVFVEGLVHVTELGQDYYHFDATRHQMLGERTGKRFRLGDKVRIRVVQVDIESSRIDFALVDEAAAGKSVGHATAPSKTKAKPQAKPQATVTRPATAGKVNKSGGKGR
jgi:ribonuclease R